jgi:hypothetical protein
MANFLYDATEVVNLLFSRLPLDSVMLVFSELMSKVQELQALHKSNPTGPVLDYLGRISLKHILPTPPPLNPRRFIVSFISLAVH